MILVLNIMVKTVLSLIIDDFSYVSSQIFVNFVGGFYYCGSRCLFQYLSKEKFLIFLIYLWQM